MRKIRNELVTCYSLTVFLILFLFFSASYFVIGRNFDYMSKSQNQINSEIVAVLSDSPVEQWSQDDINKVLQKAGDYNVGISIATKTGQAETQQVDSRRRILTLEYGGHLITKQISFENGMGLVKLTYFRSIFTGDDTVKYFPAFWRLAAAFLILAFVITPVVALIAAGSIKSDIRKARAITSNLIKGSSVGAGKPPAYKEFEALLEELNSLREIVLKKEQLKKRMTADFAHELRTPLTTLQSHLEALIDGVWEPTTERFVSCHEEILRLIRLVGDLDRLSKFEDENIVLDKTSFDITELATSISRNFEGELSHRNITLKVSGASQVIRADKDKISQVIVNLLSNSLKYTPVNGRILMDISGDKDYIYLVINDSGVGIPARDISNVFNRLYRSDTSRTRATGGAGIGLTIAKSIVEAHRGSIDIISQEGLGTEINVIFPRS